MVVQVGQFRLVQIGRHLGAQGSAIDQEGAKQVLTAAALGWFARPAEDVQQAVYFLLGDDDPASTPRAAGGAPAGASAFPGLPDRRGLLPGSVAERDWYGAGGRQGSDLDAQQAAGPVLSLGAPARPMPDDERRTVGLLCQGPPDRCRPCTPPATVLAPLTAVVI